MDNENMDSNPRTQDTRDARTMDTRLPQGRDMHQDPANTSNLRATHSDYTTREIDAGETPLDEGMDLMIDPSLGEERMSTNFDVLDLDSSYLVEGEEPDFMQDPGTTDVIEAVEEGEPYFPPTDPVTRINGNTLDVVGGFAGTSLEGSLDPDEHPARLMTNDEELEERVRIALTSDAYTAELNVEVEVNDGVVYLHGTVTSLDDIEQAEQVAGSVDGVADVEEDLEIV